MALIQDLNSITGFNGSDIIIVDDGSETQTGTITQLTSYLSANLSIPTGIDDITGLQTALDGKAPLVHTHQISDIVDLQTELNTKFDSTTAGVVNNVVIIGNTSVDVIGLINERVADITGVSPTDSRIPGNVTSGNFLQFASADGTIGEVTANQFKSDLLLNNVDNTADLNKPISTATQTALDAKVSNTFFTSDKDTQDAAIALNTAKVSYTDASAVALNTAKRSYPTSDESKLDGIEAGANVTDTANVWSSLGISTGGSTSRFLTQRGVFVEGSTGSGTGGGGGTTVIGNPGGVDGNTPALTSILIGNDLYDVPTSGLGVLVSGISSNVTLASGAAETIHFTVSGAPSTVVNVSIVNTDPTDWVVTSSLTELQLTLNGLGEGTTSITLPTLDDGTRSFQLAAQVQGGFQGQVLSPIVRQTAEASIDSVTLGNITFGNQNIVEDVTVTGTPHLPFTFAIENTSPMGWITSGALGASSGTLNENGMFTTTISIPNDVDDTFTRTFQIRATGTGVFNSATAISAVITQAHTQTTPSGDLNADATFVYSHPDIDVNVNVTTGDAPFSIVLNENPTDATAAGLFVGTLNSTGSLTIPTFQPVFVNTSGAVADKSTLSTSTNNGWGQAGTTIVLADAGNDDTGGASGDRLFVGGTSGATGAGTIAFWGNGISHSASNPVVIITDNAPSNSTNFGSNPTWIFTNIPTDDLLFLKSIATNETINGGNSYYTIPEANWELWEDSSGIPEQTESDIPTATKNYYVHVTDADGDVVVDMETIEVLNEAPSGSIALTQGSASPEDGDTVELDATFTDTEDDPLGYQWQIGVGGNNISLAADKSSLATSTTSGWGQSGSPIVLLDAGNDDTGGASGDRLFIGATLGTSSNSCRVLFWNDGQDHRFDPPVISLFDTIPSTSSNFGDNPTWRFDSLTTDQLLTLKGLATNETVTGGNSYYTIPDANWELWEGSTVVPQTIFYLDIAGETDSTHSFTADLSISVDLTNAEDLANVNESQYGGHAVIRIDPDVGFSAAQRVYWGNNTGGSTNADSTLYIWRTGDDHATTAPIYSFTDNFANIASQYDPSVASFLMISDFDATGDLEGMAVSTSSSANFVIPDANIEIATDSTSTQGLNELAITRTLDQGGWYRTQVTATKGNEDTVTSNGILIS